MSGVIGKTIIYYELQLLSNLHIGSGESSIDTDSLCQRDSEGNVKISGSSIAGLFRSNLEELFDEQALIDKLFGKVEEDGNVASDVLFEHAYVKRGNECECDVRDGVGINRKYRSAQAKKKYDQETVVRGAVFEGIITINKTEANKANHDKYTQLLKAAFYNLDERLIALGGSTSRGLGNCKVAECFTVELDFAGDDLEAYLLNDFYDYSSKGEEFIRKRQAPFDYRAEYCDGFERKRDDYLIKIDYRLTSRGRLLINGPRTNLEDVDLNFITSGGEVFIPGSSFKGPFRSRAEMILRTMGVPSICDPVERSCAEQEDKPCFTCRLFGSTESKSKAAFSDMHLNANGRNAAFKFFDHSKIGRFTSGTIEGALYQEKTIYYANFTGTIVIERLDSLAEVKLLAMVFKDLYLEDLRLGHGKSNGGKVRGSIDKIRIYDNGKSTLNGTCLADYLQFNSKEGPYSVCEIDGSGIEAIAGQDQPEIYDRFMKMLDGVTYGNP